MRIQRLDAYRLYIMLIIIWGHVYFWGVIDHNPLPVKSFYYLVTIGFRFAVPYFFIMVGYFTGWKIIQEPEKAVSIARSYTGHLLIAFLFWSLVYIVERPQAFLTLLHEEPVKVIFQGPRDHLWFLVSLILTVWLFVFWPYRKNYKSFLLPGLILYGIGLLAGPYKTTPLGFDLHFDTRNAVFFSTLFFAIGVAMRSVKLPKLSWRVAAGLVLAGFALYCLETVCLRMFWGVGVTRSDYLLSSIPYGIAVALFALTQPDTALDKLAGPYGRYTIGIYAGHILFLDLLQPIGAWVNPYILQFLYPVLIFVLSLATCLILSRTFLRKVVT
jgi:surface polysaccharide O-acyltransferase-like enzyme